jgi:hypothetical protein
MRLPLTYESVQVVEGNWYSYRDRKNSLQGIADSLIIWYNKWTN